MLVPHKWIFFATRLLRVLNLFQLFYTLDTKTKFPLLTKREKETLQLIAEGLTKVQIVENLFISIDTIDTLCKNLHHKLNIINTATIVEVATEHHLL